MRSPRWALVAAVVAVMVGTGFGAVRQQPVTSPPTVVSTPDATSTVVVALTVTPTPTPTPWPTSMIPPDEIVFNCWGVCIAAVGGTGWVRVASDAADASWSPDGTMPAFRGAVGPHRVSFDRDLVVRDVASGDERAMAARALTLRGLVA